MIQIDLLQIEADLAHYIEQVVRGETIVVTRDNQPIAELRPITPSISKPRQIGLAKGTFEIPASFYEPLPSDVIDSFNGEKLDSVNPSGDSLPADRCHGREVIVEDLELASADHVDEWCRELQLLGSVQYEPGEWEQAQLLLKEADEQAKSIVRREMGLD
jgi:antitoxin (DNA-binding transcriptional repressor) of toxin-antitoxin stability system